MNTLVNLGHPWKRISHSSLNFSLQDPCISFHHANKLKFITVSHDDSISECMINVFNLKKIVSIGIVLNVKVGKLIYIVKDDMVFMISHISNDVSLSSLIYIAMNLKNLTVVYHIYENIQFHLLDNTTRCQLCLVDNRLIILGPRPDSIQYMYEIEILNLDIHKIKTIRKPDLQDSFIHWTYDNEIYQLRTSNSTLHIYTYHQDRKISCRVIDLHECISDQVYELRTITPDCIILKIYSHIKYVKIYFNGVIARFQYCVDFIVDNDVHCFYPQRQLKYKEVKINKESSVHIRTVHDQSVLGISEVVGPQTISIQCNDGVIHVIENYLTDIDYFKVIASGKFKHQIPVLPFNKLTFKNWLKFRISGYLLENSRYQELIDVVILTDFLGDIVNMEKCYKLLEHPDFGLPNIISNQQLMMIHDIERRVIESVADSARGYMFRNQEINSLIQNMSDDQKVKMVNYLTN